MKRQLEGGDVAERGTLENDNGGGSSMGGDNDGSSLLTYESEDES